MTLLVYSTASVYVSYNDVVAMSMVDSGQCSIMQKVDGKIISSVIPVGHHILCNL